MRMAPPKMLRVAGAAIAAAALVWWWATFGDVVQYGYLSWREAGGCLVSDSDLCALARVLCLGAHPRALAAYWTSAFWLGVGVLSLGLLAPDKGAAKKRVRASIVSSKELTSP
jgi:hypothetical protein